MDVGILAEFGRRIKSKNDQKAQHKHIRDCIAGKVQPMAEYSRWKDSDDIGFEPQLNKENR